MNNSIALTNRPFFHSFVAISTWIYAKVLERANLAPAGSRQKRDELCFSPNQVREISRPFGATVECLAGSVWVTIDGDSRDVILDAGQSMRVDRDRRTLIMALGQARVRCVGTVSA